MNGPHDSECIKSLHVLIRLAASYHLPQYYAKTAQFEFKEKHVLQDCALRKNWLKGAQYPEPVKSSVSPPVLLWIYVYFFSSVTYLIV